MSDYDGYEQGRSRTTVAIVVTVVLLAVLGGSVGFIVARSGAGKDRATPSPSAAPTGGATATASTGAGKSTKATGQTSTRPSKSYPPANAADCPAQTKDAAGTALLLVQYLLTARSEVWICRDNPGGLYYQGHVRGSAFTSATSDTSIFVIDVRQEGGNYRATNNNTVYIVAPDRLRIVTNGSETNNEPSVNR